MNRRTIGISLACASLLAAGNYSAWADKVPLTQLPEAVQKAIKQQSQGETLQHVERETRDGQMVYEAEFQREGLNRRVTIAADGSVLPDRGLTSKLQSELGSKFDKSPSVAMSDLPAAVQKTIKEQQGGRMVADIDKETWNGQSVYEVEFKDKGPNSRIYVANDGTLVVDKERKSGTYLGTQFSDTPAAVQARVKQTVSNADIQDVDREMKDGQVVYDVEVKQEGLNRHLKIAENGTLLEDSNQRDSRGIGERVRERVGLDRDAEMLSLEQLPSPVQKSIKENCDEGTLKPIKRVMRNGHAEYDAEFEKQGKNVRITVAEDGKIVKDNR
jgi:uncharacterized membrane protein YkoI